MTKPLQNCMSMPSAVVMGEGEKTEKENHAQYFKVSLW